MSVRDLLRSLGRRWYLLVAGLLLTASLCTAAFQWVRPSYEASGSILLLPPKSSVGSRGNPYLYLGGLTQASEVLSARLNTATVTGPIEDRYPGITLVMGPDTTTTGPILSVEVTATSNAAAVGALQEAMGSVPGTLARMQDDLEVPTSSRIGLLDLTTDARPTVVTKARDRVAITLAAAGLAATLLLTAFVDGLLAVRRPRTRRPRQAAPGWVVEDDDPAGPAAAPEAVAQVEPPRRDRADLATADR